jgi:uncharacterized protein with PIN domain
MIVKHRGSVKPKKFTSKCRECGSVMEATSEELKWEHFPRNETLAREKCPICKAEIFFYP